jgi:hypothetical protein
LSLVPESTKKKYFNEMKNFEDQINKQKKTYYDLRLSRNKTKNFEDDVKLIRIYLILSLFRMILENL